MRKLLVLLVAVAGLALAASAAGRTGPVPAGAAAAIKARAGVYAYLPTRVPLGFHYRSWTFGSGVLRIRFENKAHWEIVWVVATQHGPCTAGKQKSFQLDGNKVYWGATASE